MQPETPAPPQNTAEEEPADKWQTQVTRTQVGLLVLAVGVLLLVIPVFLFPGVLTVAGGAILLFRGAAVFGRRHKILVGVAALLFAAAEAATFFAGNLFGNATYAASVSGSAAAMATILMNALNVLTVASILGGIAFGVSCALFALSLEDRWGRILLVAGAATQAAVTVFVNGFLIDPRMRTAILVTTANAHPDIGSVVSAWNQRYFLTAPLVLAAVPAACFAAAYGWALYRMRRTETAPPATVETGAARRVLVALAVAVLVVSGIAVGGTAVGVFSTVPPPGPSWSRTATFNGTTIGRTGNFTITGNGAFVNATFTGDGPGTFAWSVHEAGTDANFGSCAVPVQPNVTRDVNCGGPPHGTYYAEVTNTTGVPSWSVYVMQLA